MMHNRLIAAANGPLPRTLGEAPGFLPALRAALDARPDIPRRCLLATAYDTCPARSVVSAVDLIRAALSRAERAP